MNGIKDYLLWRGDLPFCGAAPVNDVDLLIFSQLAHAPFEKLSGRTGTLLSLRDALFDEESARMICREGGMGRERLGLWQEMKEGSRFAGARLLRFDSAFDAGSEMQFAAALFSAGDTAVAAFRGTDGTLTGWKEDLNLCFAEWVPSQMRALSFLNEAAELCAREGLGRLRVCGHSKGGNLAMYAAAACLKTVRDGILSVTAFDAPGVNEKVRATAGWEEMLPKLRLYIPESSIIGLLLDTGAPKQIVDSDSVSIMQHNPFNWHVMGTGLVLTKETTRSSRYVDQVLDEFLSGLSFDRRRDMVEAVYDVLCVCEVKKVKDLPLALITHAGEIRKVLAEKPEEVRSVLGEMFTRLIAAGGGSLLSGLIRWE